MVIVTDEKGRFHYPKVDTSLRRIVDLGWNPDSKTVTAPSGLYNSKLTVGELSILRSILWDIRELAKKNPDNHEIKYGEHYFTVLIQSWLLGEEKEPVIFSDIVQDFENGVLYEERPYGS